MRWWLALVVVGLFALTAYSAFAVVSNENIFGPSQVTQLDTPVPGTCGQTWMCPDENFTVQADFTVAMADGSTAAGSQINLRNNNGAGRAAMLYWSVDVQSTGNYSLKILPSATITLVIAPYVNSTHVNTSITGNVSLTSAVWSTFDLNSLIRDMHASLGDVRLRFWTTSTTSSGISEVYLVAPPSPGQFQIIDQGARIARTDAWVENEWLVISPMDQFRISNATCTIESIESLVDTFVNVTLNVTTIRGAGTSPDKLRVRWYANSTWVVEGRNYEVECDASFDGVPIKGLEQYVYITQEGTAASFFTSFARWLKALFVDLTVQTSVLERSVAVGVPQQVIVEVLRDKRPFEGANCSLTLYNGSNMGVLLNNVSMTYYQGGFYNYTFTPSSSETAYVVRSYCTLNNSENVSTYQASGTLEVATSSSVDVDQIFEGTPSIELLSQRFYAGTLSQILLRLSVGSDSVTNANCNVTLYNGTFGKIVDNQPMLHLESGMYYRNWTPPQYTASNYPVRAICYGGALGTKEVQSAASMTVEYGVIMQDV